MKIIITLIVCLAVSPFSMAAAVAGQGSWQTTLLARDLDGDDTTAEAYYDTILDITWLADANFAQTTSYDSDGLMAWPDATEWANQLNIWDFTEWRLPATADLGDSGCGSGDTLFQGVVCGYNLTMHSEMSYMFYETLGNLAIFDISGNIHQGWGLTNTGPFSNLQSSDYWSQTEFRTVLELPLVLGAWYFDYNYGAQGSDDKLLAYNHAWVVHDGDIGSVVVPLPAAAWFFLSAIGSLFGFRRRR